MNKVLNNVKLSADPDSVSFIQWHMFISSFLERSYSDVTSQVAKPMLELLSMSMLPYHSF